jgi:hypothetical protein
VDSTAPDASAPAAACTPPGGWYACTVSNHCW